MIPSPKNIDNSTLSHFKEVPNTANINPTETTLPNFMPSRSELENMIRRVWLSNIQSLKAYDYGANIGFTKSNKITLHMMLNGFVNALKQLISNEIGVTSNDYKPIYTALENILEILVNKVLSEPNKDQYEATMAILAGLHGFINIYVNSVKEIK